MMLIAQSQTTSTTSPSAQLVPMQTLQPQQHDQPVLTTNGNGNGSGHGTANAALYHLQPQSEAIKLPRLISPATSPCNGATSSSPMPMHAAPSTSLVLSTSSSAASCGGSKKSPATSPTMSRLPALQYAISTHRRGDLRLPALVSPMATTPTSASSTSMIRPERDSSDHVAHARSAFASSLQLSMQECETPHYPTAKLCCPPEASPIEKKQAISGSVGMSTGIASCCVSSSSSSSCSSRSCDSPHPQESDDDVMTAGTNSNDNVSVSANENSSHPAVSIASNNRKKGTRRGTLNAEAKNVLKAWMFSPEHIEHPYPSEEEKEELASEAGIEVKQLSNWFTNARKRLWQPVLRQSGVEVKNFLSTGRGGPRGNNKLKLPAHLHHIMASQRLLDGNSVGCPSSSGSVCSDSTPPMSPSPGDSNDSSNERGSLSNAVSFSSPQKRKFSEIQKVDLNNSNGHKQHQARDGKKSKPSCQRKRNSLKEHALTNSLQAKNGLLGAPSTGATTPNDLLTDFEHPSAKVAMLSRISQELRMALAEKKTMPHLQELEILAATSLIGLHHQQSVY